MKVVNNYTNYKYNSYINYKGSPLRDKIITIMHLNPLRHFKNFSLEEYNKLNSREINTLRKRYNILKSKNIEYYNEIEKLHNVLSGEMQKRFDSIYGKGKYTIIVIGRSLSSIGKVLGYKIGEENVKNIPMSSAQRYHSLRLAKEAEDKNKLDIFLNFLKRINIGKEDILKKDNHKYVIVDFCSSGFSLKAAFDFLTSKFVYGTTKNLCTDDVLNTCIKDAALKFQMQNIFHNHGLKKYSFVKKCQNIEDTPNSIINPAKADNETKLFWFNLLDKENERLK